MDELDAALATVAGVGPEVAWAADNLREVVSVLGEREEGSEMFFDLSELRGYHYHTGIVFSAFVAGHGREVARGGRYDDVGAAFGRARAATGFSLDLRQVTALGNGGSDRTGACILAPPRDDDTRLNAAVEALRDKGERVVRALNDREPAPRCCDRRLVPGNNGWQVITISAGGRPGPGDS